MAKKERPGVLVYFDIEPAVNMLDDAQRGQLFSAILSYAHYGAAPIFENQLLKMAWSFIQPSIDRANEKYADTVQKKKIAGITSDFRRNYAPKNGLDPEDDGALQEYIRQRLSASADYSNPNPIKEETEPNENSIQTQKETVAEKGCGGKPHAQPLADFEELRRQALARLRESG